MNTLVGDIWDYWDKGYDIVVPVNIGWRRDGSNVMGAGVARQAAARFPRLSDTLGTYHQLMRERSRPLPYAPIGTAQIIWCLPVKPLNQDAPWLSWKSEASVPLIESSLQELASAVEPGARVALPLVGCGNGGLSRDQVYPVLSQILDRRFTLVELEA